MRRLLLAAAAASSINTETAAAMGGIDVPSTSCGRPADLTCGSSMMQSSATKLQVYSTHSTPLPCDCSGDDCDGRRSEQPCEGLPLGTVFDACAGPDSEVTLSFDVTLFLDGQTRYDAGIYLSSGTSADGRRECRYNPLNYGTYGSVSVEEVEAEPDNCHDMLARPVRRDALCELGSDCLCGVCSDCNALPWDASCGANCLYEQGDYPKPLSVKLQICNAPPTIVVDFKHCTAEVTGVNGVYEIRKPLSGCGDLDTLQPNVYVDGTELHTSCSEPFYLGQTWQGETVGTIKLIGYVLRDGRHNAVDVGSCGNYARHLRDEEIAGHSEMNARILDKPFMFSYPLGPFTLPCSDTNGDGLLDVDLSVVWSSQDGSFFCDNEQESSWPRAEIGSECWSDNITLPVYVPTEPDTLVDPTPQAQVEQSLVSFDEQVPDNSTSDTQSPSQFEISLEQCTTDFQLCFALDMSGSVCNRDMNINCDYCSPQLSCRDQGFVPGQCCSNFVEITDFAAQMTESFHDYPANVMTSVVSFSGYATIEMGLGTRNATLDALDELVYTGGWTDHSDALQSCASTLNGDAQSFILLITDGVPTQPADPQREGIMAAADAKNDGHQILPVFISNTYDLAAHEYMSTMSSDGRVWDVSDFEGLNQLIANLTSVLCRNTATARNDEATTVSGSSVSIDVLSNDSGNGTLAIRDTGKPSAGGIMYGGAMDEGLIRYQPLQGFVGEDSFSYEMCDEAGSCDMAIVDVLVVEPPLANDDYVTAESGSLIDLDLCENDVFGDNAVVDFTLFQPAHGFVRRRGDLCIVTVETDHDYEGDDEFDYIVCTPTGCDRATAHLTIVPPAPCVEDFNVCFAMDMSGSVCNRGAHVNCGHCNPSYMCQDVGFDQSTCCANFSREVEFVLRLTESFEHFQRVVRASFVSFATEASVVSELGPVNDTLAVLNKLTYTGGWTDHKTAIDSCQSTFSNTESDVRNIILLITDGKATQPLNPMRAGLEAAARVKEAGSFLVPIFIDQTQNDAEALDYMSALASDGVHYDVTAFTQLNGLIANLTQKLCRPPIETVLDIAQTTVNTPVLIPLLDNDSGVEMHVQSLHQASFGTPYGGGTVPEGYSVYYPDLNFVGTDSFSYTGCDAYGQCDEASVTVAVLALQAVDDVAKTPRETPVEIDVLRNDLSDGPLIIESFSSLPTNGKVNILDGEKVVYQPAVGFSGKDIFNYQTCKVEEIKECSAATVTVDVLPWPIALPDSAETAPGDPVSVDILENDLGLTLVISEILRQPTNGQVSVEADSVTYTPNSNFEGNDEFVYRTCEEDEITACNEALVSVRVVPVEPTSAPSQDPTVNLTKNPTDAPSSLPTAEPTTEPTGPPTVNPTRNPTDAPSSLPTAEPTTEPTGPPTVNPTKNPTNGPSSLPTAEPTTEPTGSPTSSSLQDLNQPPIALPDYVTVRAFDDTRSVEEGGVVFAEVLENDIGSDLIVTDAAGPNDGICIVIGDQVMYTPRIGFTGTDQCVYTACTDQTTDACDTARLIISVLESPTYEPSAAPSSSPTEAWYYPDFTYESNVCLNDYLEPEYMLQHQRDNYLYRSKEECCQNHFWWRITQCMGNEHPMYFSDGEKCDQKVYFDNHEAKFTPGDWLSADLFENLEECCKAKFWWDVPSCMSNSPKELKVYFTVSISQLNEPAFCQDADIIATSLEVAIEMELEPDMKANVTSLGCASIIRDTSTGNSVCGGCLRGSDFLGGTDGSTVVEDATDAVTSVTFEIRKRCYDSKDEEAVEGLTSSIVSLLSGYINSGRLTQNIQRWANQRIPSVGQLLSAAVLSDSFLVVKVVSPFDSDNDAPFYPDWTNAGKCIQGNLYPTYMRNNPSYYLFDSLKGCCSSFFSGQTSCESLR